MEAIARRNRLQNPLRDAEGSIQMQSHMVVRLCINHNFPIMHMVFALWKVQKCVKIAHREVQYDRINTIAYLLKYLQVSGLHGLAEKLKRHKIPLLLDSTNERVQIQACLSFAERGGERRRSLQRVGGGVTEVYTL